MAGEVAAHARGTIHHWQIRNEPDLDTRFDGPPQEYARMLGLAHLHIKARVPEATIVLGGLLRSPNEGWLELFFAAAGPDAARSFDVASVHVRGRLAVVVGQLRAVRAAFARYGFVGPFWVTEHAYPADPVYQPEPAFGSGEPGQAAYLTESVLTLAEAGAEQVFVTLKDDFAGQFASEGVVEIAGTAPYESRRKLSFHALGRLSGRWNELWALTCSGADTSSLSRCMTSSSTRNGWLPGWLAAVGAMPASLSGPTSEPPGRSCRPPDSAAAGRSPGPRAQHGNVHTFFRPASCAQPNAPPLVLSGWPNGVSRATVKKP